MLLFVGLANLIGGLVLGAGGLVPATRLVLELVAANFAVFAWGLVVVGSGVVMAGHRNCRGPSLTARCAALAGLVLAALVLAALAGIGYQLLRGHLDLELPLYAAGLALNVGWNSLHLAALAVCAQAVSSRRWIGMLAATAVFAASNLAFDHDLLRFGAAIAPWSDMNGYGHGLGQQIALGLYWTGLCAALLAGVQLGVRGGRVPHEARSSAGDHASRPDSGSAFAVLRRRLTPNVVATGWGGLVVALATGSWVLLNAADREDIVDAEPVAGVQPEYSRLNLEVDVAPEARRLRSRGTAILVNRHDTAIADVFFAVPPGLVVGDLSLTGEPLRGATPDRLRGYRLNRPLEPGETLRVAFDLHSRPGRALDGVRANGTFLTTADIVPAIGTGAAETFFANSPPVAFAVRLGTALDQTPVAPGVVQRQWKENATRYIEYRTANPIRPLATIHSARYAVAHSDWHGIPVEVYHHHAHRGAVQRMLRQAAARLEHPTRTAPYPHAQFRVVEVPDYEPIFGLPGLLAFNPRHRPAATRLAAQPALAGVLPYSEVAALALPPSGASMR